MYIENDEFGKWMQKLYAKLEELCKDVRVLRNADRVLPEDDKGCFVGEVERGKGLFIDALL